LKRFVDVWGRPAWAFVLFKPGDDASLQRGEAGVPGTVFFRPENRVGGRGGFGCSRSTKFPHDGREVPRDSRDEA